MKKSKQKNLDSEPRELQESNGKRSKKIVASLLIASLASSLCLGTVDIAEVKAAGRVIAIEVPVTAEVEKKAFQEFREFKDLGELTEWLKNNGLPIRIIADEDGNIDLLHRKSTSQYDCDDYAEALQRKALEQGFLMSQQLVLNGQVYGRKVSEYTEPHMGNLTVIGNAIYYIESVPPHNIVRITSRD